MVWSEKITLANGSECWDPPETEITLLYKMGKYITARSDVAGLYAQQPRALRSQGVVWINHNIMTRGNIIDL